MEQRRLGPLSVSLVGLGCNNFGTFAWLLGLPAMASVIAGATSPEQVLANAAAAGWTLSADDRVQLDALLAGG